MDHCETCGDVVTDDFARAFGTNSNRMFACPECASMRDIVDGGAAAFGTPTSMPAE